MTPKQTIKILDDHLVTAFAHIGAQAGNIARLRYALIEAEKHFGPFADITINGEHDPDDVRVVSIIRNALQVSP